MEYNKIKIDYDSWKDKLPSLKILHISDFHFSFNDPKAIEIINLIKGKEYDFCFLTGDYIKSIKAIKDCIKVVSKINTKNGTYAIWGNHDYRFDIKSLKKSLLANGVKLLVNQSDSIEYGKNLVNIIGLDVSVHDDVNPDVLKRGDMKKALSGVNPGFNILLSHSPDLIEEASEKDIDLMLSGHTHGGQVNFPIIGPVYASSKFGIKYASGLFKEGKTRLFVTRGIGNVKVNLFGFSMKIPFSDIRFLCKPEVNEITIN